MRTAVLACCVAIVVGGLASVALAAPAGGPEVAERGKRCMPPERVERAERYADRRAGRVSFAFEDECRRLVGDHRFRRHSSASVVKLMLLVAYLRQGNVGDRGLKGSERHTLGPMIKSSDNGAADQIFSEVRQGGLNDLGKDAGMEKLGFGPHWGGTQITAGDQAAFFQRIERFVPRRHEDYVFKLTSRIVGSQSWSIPQAAPRGWKVSFKGGWYPAGDGWRVNQVATLRRNGRRISLAVLTDGGPSFGYGQKTIRRVARILLKGYRR